MAPEDVSLHGLPMFHIGAISGMLTGIVAGGAHCFLSRFDAVDWMRAVAEQRVTRSSLGPTMIKMVLDHARFGEFDLSSLKRLHYGTAAMPEALLEETIRKLPNTGLIQGYGQTEASGTVSLLAQRYHTLNGPFVGKLRSAGQAVPGINLRVTNEAGEVLPAGGVGEVCVRGDNVMLGYWRQPQETELALRNGWLRTGDAGYLDDDGFLYIVDRQKDMIVTGGENVFSAEVEATLFRHAAILECAVIGIPDDKWGEQVHAIVRLRPGSSVTDADLISHCAGFIARFKCPKGITFRADPLPVSAVGKVLKAELRAPFFAGRSRNVN
jgi:long-chain acyl-CoA synthetase